MKFFLKLCFPKKTTSLFWGFFLVCILNSAGQASLNDCVGAIEVCGNGFISSNATGAGKQEVNSLNSCSGMEHNSLWIKINITKSGTLGFTLTPTDTSLSIDYDFFVFGPDASCGDLGNSIRCSTTNPLQAGLAHNFTGMRDRETEDFEGPGADGNSFVRSLDVEPGETYYIVIDRPIGQSPFELEWTGTSTAGDPPFPEGVTVNQPSDMFKCGINGVAEFDIFDNRDEINNQPHTSISYYGQLEDAIDETRELTDPYTSNQRQKTIYVRVENEATGCYQIVDFDLVIPEGPPIATEINYELCDLDGNGTELFDLASQQGLLLRGLLPEDHLSSYFRTVEDAVENLNILSPLQTSAGETIFARVQERNAPGCFNIAEINLILNAPSDLSGINPEQIGISISSRTIILELGGQEQFEISLDNPAGPYMEVTALRNVSPGLRTIYIRRKGRCELNSLEVIVPEYSNFFTPNNDSFNDEWTISTGDYDFPEKVKIFDRYGKTVAGIQVNSEGWDGTYNGEDLPADDYWFVLTLPVGKEIKDHFSLIR